MYFYNHIYYSLVTFTNFQLKKTEFNKLTQQGLTYHKTN